MNITPDAIVYFKIGFLEINATILCTWVVMLFAFIIAIVVRIFLTSNFKINKLQNFLEMLTLTIESQIKSINPHMDMKMIFPFIASMFSFILLSNLLGLIPFVKTPTSSLSTTLALVVVMLIFAWFYGIKRVGFKKFMSKYTRPSPVMLPLNVIGDIAGNFALAIRLYGNMMSSMIIGAIVSEIAFLALGFPIFLHILSCLGAVIQSYIFSILSLVFIANAESQ